MAQDIGGKIMRLSEIDEEATINAGKRIFYQYYPLVEKRIRELLKSPISSSGVVKLTNKNKSVLEDKMTKKIIWNEDQIGLFIRYILQLEKNDKKIGEFLKWKCFYNMTDKQISGKMKVSERTLRNYKAKAYYQLAVFANQVQFKN